MILLIHNDDKIIKLICLLTGMMACDVAGLNLPCQDKPITSRLPIICGTSSCHMAVSKVYCDGGKQYLNLNFPYVV